MNKAPVTQPPRRSFGLFGRRRQPDAHVLPVAQPLTEEEAAAELARARAEHDAERQAREEKLRRKEAEKAARIAAKEARRAARRAAEADSPADMPPVQASGNRFIFSLSTAACIGAVGLVCAAILSAYVMGQRAARKGGRLATVAATSTPVAESSSPLLPGPASPQTASLSSADSRASPAPQAPADEPITDNPDLAHLLKRPQMAEPQVNPNQPVRLDASAPAAGAKPESLNYLQIESFLVSRDRTSELLARDVAEVRAFLAERGVRTFARKRHNGYVLFAEEGFPPGKETRRQREAFIRHVEKLGAEFRQLGGQYQFKGCFFVSYGSTQAGDPV